jgi:hypothetical protein
VDYEANLLSTDAMARLPHDLIQRHHPLRSPAWRWERAQWLLDRHFYFSRLRDDQPTGRALHFLRELSRPHRRALNRAAKCDPDLTAAHQLYERSGPTGLLVEARLLMGQDSAEIERQTAVPNSVVDVYEAVFFNCRDRLHARDWVVCCALDTPPSAAWVGPDKAAVLKRFAFFGGPLIFEAVRPYLLDGKDLFEPPLDLATPEGRCEQIIRLAVAVHLLPNDAATQWKLQKVMLLVQEREREREKQRREMGFEAENADWGALGCLFEAPTSSSPAPPQTPPAAPEPSFEQVAQAG